MEKDPNKHKMENSSLEIPQELKDLIVSLKKQNANSTFELLKTRKELNEFKKRIENLENIIAKADPEQIQQEEEQELLAKLHELKRFLK